MRLSICVFWNKNGILQKYVKFYIEALKSISDRLIIVVNGSITDDARSEIENTGAEVIVRENIGLDFAAYKFGLNYVGFDNLTQYDTLILTNTTCYGPLYPFNVLLKKMENADCDFFGITEHSEYDDKEWLQKKVKRHLQSYFLYFKKQVFQSLKFKDFFSNIIDNKPLTYRDVISLYESELTSYLADSGFKYDCLVNCKKYFDRTLNPAIENSLELLKSENLPLIKVKSLVFDPEYAIRKDFTDNLLNTVSYLQENTSYDVSLIYDDLCRNFELSTVKFFLKNNKVISDRRYADSIYCLKTGDFAVVAYIDSLSSLELMLSRFKNIPKNGSIYIFIKESLFSDCIKEKLSSLSDIEVTVQSVDDSLSYIEVYFDNAKAVFKQYKYVCCVHTFNGDTETKNAAYILYKKHLDGLFSSKDYVLNVLSYLEEHKETGIIVNPVPVNSEYANNLWGNSVDTVGNKEKFNHLRETLNISVPFDSMKLASYFGMFILRSESIKECFNSECNFKELLSDDSPIPSVIENEFDIILPQLIQEKGFFTATVTPENNISPYMDSMYFSTRILYPEICPEIYTFSKNLPPKVNYVKKFKIKFILKNIITVKKTFDQKFHYLSILGNNFLLKK